MLKFAQCFPVSSYAHILATSNKQTKSHTMTTQDKLNQVAKQLEELNAYNKALNALAYLEDLWENATFSSPFMAAHTGDDTYVAKKLFYSHPLNFIRDNRNELTFQVADKATHFKHMDDSQEQPEWRNRAYNLAKTLTDFYNSEFNRDNKYFY